MEGKPSILILSKGKRAGGIFHNQPIIQVKTFSI
jgi:hypothetical protein